MENRRTFLKKGLALGALIGAPSIVSAANDYSVKSNPEQKKYIYNPFENNRKIVTSTKETKPNSGNVQIKNNILPQDSNMQKSFWDNPRMIQLKRAQTGENARIVYFENGKINNEGYKLASYLLRDVRQGQIVNMDLRLLDLIAAVQAWLMYYGYTMPLRVTSGYRSSKTNNSLEGAAKNSMHLYGKAIDFTVPGLTSAQLANIATQFKAGGVGIYPNQNFVHLDTGGVRTWVKR